jgi:hypothetical protein
MYIPLAKGVLSLVAVVTVSACGLEPNLSVSLQGESESTVGVVINEKRALRLAYQSCQQNPFTEAPPLPGVETQSNASAGGVLGSASFKALGRFRLQADDGTNLQEFNANLTPISQFTVENAEIKVEASTQRAKLAAQAAALDPYWQPLSEQHRIEEGGDKSALLDLEDRRISNGRDGGDWAFIRYEAYWERQNIPLVRSTIDEYCRQSATRMNLL